MFKFLKDIQEIKEKVYDLEIENNVLKSQIFNLEYPDGRICYEISLSIYNRFLNYTWGILDKQNARIPHLKVDKWAVKGEMLYIEDDGKVSKYLILKEVSKVKKVETELPEDLNWH